MTAYASAASLAIFLQRALTAAEAASATAACAAASTYIDMWTRKTWQETTVTGELQTVQDGRVWLRQKPVSAITTVTARTLWVGETPRVLVAGVGYELIDALHGILITNESDGVVLTITYTLAAPAPPADIALAANIIAASYLIEAPAASLQARGIQKLEAGSAKITYDPIDHSMPIPPTAYALLENYRPAFVVA